MESEFLEEIQTSHDFFMVPFQRPLLERLSRQLAKGLADKIKWAVDMIDLWFSSYPPTNSVVEQRAVEALQKDWRGLEHLPIIPL